MRACLRVGGLASIVVALLAPSTRARADVDLALHFVADERVELFATRDDTDSPDQETSAPRLSPPSYSLTASIGDDELHATLGNYGGSLEARAELLAWLFADLQTSLAQSSGISELGDVHAIVLSPTLASSANLSAEHPAGAVSIGVTCENFPFNTIQLLASASLVF